MPTKHRRAIYLAAVTLLAIVTFIALGGGKLLLPAVDDISTDAAIHLIDDGQVQKAVLLDDTNGIILTTNDGSKKASSYLRVDGSRITQKLLDKNVPFDTRPPSRNQALDLVGTLIPIVVVLFIFMMIRPDALKKGKFAAHPTIPSTRFDDIAGADEAVAELRELVAMTKDGEAYAAMGAKAPRGAVLVGPSGTGKTLLARAVAGESGLPFFAVAGSDFVEEIAGRGPRRVRELFKAARKAGGVIFIDEIDSIGQRRDELRGGGDSQERLNVVTALLDALDGFTPRDNVIFLAATNRVDSMDPALLRPGRLDRQIQVPLPDRVGREAIFQVHLKGKVIDGDLDVSAAAAQTAGMSGAEIEAVINQACMIAVRTMQPGINDVMIQEAVNVVAMGQSRKSAYLSDRDKLVTAVHEGGHATCGIILAARDPEHSKRPTFVTVIPRGPAGGFTRFDAPDGQYVSLRALRNQLVVAMGGRAAEIARFGPDGFTTGAAGDFVAATDVARQMVMRFGMGGSGALTARVESSDAVDAEVEALLTAALDEAMGILSSPEGGALSSALVDALVEEESLTAAGLAAVEASCRVELAA